VEIVGDGVDGDGDGVVNQFGCGDQTALAIYLAAQPRPVTKLELADAGLEQLGSEEREAIARGEALFEQAECMSCNTPALVLEDPIFSEPSLNMFFRDDRFPAGQDPISVGVDPADRIWFDLTRDPPDNVVDSGSTEVRHSRTAFVRLSEQEQSHLLAFLNNFVRLKLEQPAQSKQEPIGREYTKSKREPSKNYGAYARAWHSARFRCECMRCGGPHWRCAALRGRRRLKCGIDAPGRTPLK